MNLLEYARTAEYHDPVSDAELALMLQDACNVTALLGEAQRMAKRVLHDADSSHVEAYRPLRLLLHKVDDLMHLPTSIDAYEKDYWACKDIVEKKEVAT